MWLPAIMLAFLLLVNSLVVWPSMRCKDVTVDHYFTFPRAGFNVDQDGESSRDQIIHILAVILAVTIMAPAWLLLSMLGCLAYLSLCVRSIVLLWLVGHDTIKKKKSFGGKLVSAGRTRSHTHTIWQMQDRALSLSSSRSSSAIVTDQSRDCASHGYNITEGEELNGVWQHAWEQPDLSNGVRQASSKAEPQVRGQSHAVSLMSEHDDIQQLTGHDIEVDYGHNLILKEPGDERLTVKGISSTASSSLLASRPHPLVPSSSHDLSAGLTSSSGYVDTQSDMPESQRGALASTSVNGIILMATAGPSNYRVTDLMEDVQSGTTAMVPGSSQIQHSDISNGFAGKQQLLIAKLREDPEIEKSLRFICPKGCCLGTNVTISELLKSIETSHGDSICPKCWDMIDSPAMITDLEKIERKRTRADKLEPKSARLKAIKDAHRPECLPYCIGEKCSAQGQKASTTAKHLVGPNCKVSRNLSYSREQYCHIYAVLNDGQRPPADYHLELPESLHKDNYVLSNQKRRTTSDWKAAVATLEHDNTQQKRQLDSLAEQVRKQEGDIARMQREAQYREQQVEFQLRQDRLQHSKLAGQLFRLIRQNNIPLPSDIISGLWVDPELATEVRIYTRVEAESKSSPAQTQGEPQQHGGRPAHTAMGSGKGKVRSHVQQHLPIFHSNTAYGFNDRPIPVLPREPVPELPETYSIPGPFSNYSETTKSDSSFLTSNMSSNNDEEFSIFADTSRRQHRGSSAAFTEDTELFLSDTEEDHMDLQKIWNGPGR